MGMWKTLGEEEGEDGEEEDEEAFSQAFVEARRVRGVKVSHRWD